MTIYKVYEEFVAFTDGYFGGCVQIDKVKYFLNKEKAKEYYKELISNEDKWITPDSKFFIDEINVEE